MGFVWGRRGGDQIFPPALRCSQCECLKILRVEYGPLGRLWIVFWTSVGEMNFRGVQWWHFFYCTLANARGGQFHGWPRKWIGPPRSNFPGWAGVHSWCTYSAWWMQWPLCCLFLDWVVELAQYKWRTISQRNLGSSLWGDLCSWGGGFFDTE
jgi:hypothetical protein